MMKIIIVSIFVIGAIIFATALITSILNDKINRLEGEMYKLKLDLTLGSDNKVQSSLNVKSPKHSNRSGLPSSPGGVEEYERAPKPWSPFYDNSGNSALVSKPKEHKDQPYIDRMIKERRELIDKRLKLSRYLDDHKEKLSKKEIRLMNDQYRIMFKYSEILYERIGIASNKKYNR